MLLNLSQHQVDILENMLKGISVTRPEIRSLQQALSNQQDDALTGASYVERAKQEWETTTTQIDDEPSVSLSEDGAWVTAWVWVPKEGRDG